MTVQLDTLPNGLRVVSDDMPHLETTSVGVWVDTGARNEAAEINGISHLLEHMAFKGTERRSARAIAEEVEAVGGEPQRLHLGRAYGVLRPRPQGRCPARRRYSRRHPSTLDLRGLGTRTRARGRHSGDRADPRHARRRDLRSFSDGRLSRSGLGPVDPGYGRARRGLRLGATSRLHGPALPRRAHGHLRGRRRGSSPARRAGGRVLRWTCREPRRVAGTCAL